MATRNKLAANEGKSPDEGAEQEISIEKVFAEITKLSTKLTEVAADVVTIKETTTELKNCQRATGTSGGGGGENLPAGRHDRRPCDKHR